MKIQTLLDYSMQILQRDISINRGLDKSEKKEKAVLEVINVLAKFTLNFNRNMHTSYTFGCLIHIIQNTTFILLSNQRIRGNLLRVLYFIQLSV